MTLAFHHYANLFPLIEGQDFYDLAEDIRINGLHDQIDLVEIDGSYQVLDGRNRYRALIWIMTTAEALGAGWYAMAGASLSAERLSNYDSPMLFTVKDPADDLLAYVLSKNLRRRHLDESQRAMVAARLPRVTAGRPKNTPSIEGLSTERRAELLNVGRASVERAEIVQDQAAPELVEAVDRGAIAVSAAAELAGQPAARQAEILQQLPRDQDGKLTPDVKKALGPVIKELRAEKVAAKRERRAEREQTLGARLQSLPDKVFGVAIEDFEWDHEVWSRDTGRERHPSTHYETAADAHAPADIVARCADRFACLAEDCVLFKWTTIPHLAIAVEVLKLQGFRYVTHLVWNKDRPGAARGHGYWFTGEHEIVLVGVRGKVVPPAFAHFRSSFSTPVGEHSEKPPNIHEIIEFHWPNVPKVEFNARRARPGWQAWGFDAPDAAQGIAEIATIATLSSLPASGDDIGEILDVEEGFDAGEWNNSPAENEIADDGEQIAVDSPAPAATDAPACSGEVDPDAGDPSSAVIESAVPPADRPGPLLPAGEHPLDIPEFLRRGVTQAEMDLTRRDHAPAEIVDGALQMRLPLTEDEIGLHLALTQVAAGVTLDWPVLRDLVGAGFVHVPRDGRLVVTEEGQAFLAQLVPAAPMHEVRA